MCSWVKVGGISIERVHTHVAVHCVTVSPTWLHSEGLEPHLILLINTMLVKLPRGVAWPSCAQRPINICHNTGHEEASHCIIVPLHYLQSILEKRWLSVKSPSFHELINKGRSLLENVFSSSNTEEPSRAKWTTMLCKLAQFLSLDHKKKSQCTSKMHRKINRRENKTINLLNRHSESPLWQDCFCMCCSMESWIPQWEGWLEN